MSGFLQGLTCSSGGGLRCVSGGSSCTLRRDGVRWDEGKLRGGCLRGGGGRLAVLGGVGLAGFIRLPAGALQRLTVGFLRLAVEHGTVLAGTDGKYIPRGKNCL